MTVIVLEVVALIFQGIKRLIFNLPAGSSAPHETKDVALVHSHVRPPATVLDLVLATLPVLNEIDPHARIRFIERHVIDKAKAMHKPRGAVMACIIGDAPGLLSHLHLMEQKGMIAFFDPENIVKVVGL